MSVIFLDIDGVLNDHRKWANGYSPIVHENVVHLNTILAAVPDAKLVLISAWRYSFETRRAVETVLCCHGVDCAGRVNGTTTSDEWAHGGPLPGPLEMPKDWWSEKGLAWRKAQIELHITARKVERFIVIDDLPLDVPNLIKTAPNVGLTAADAALAIQKLTVVLDDGGKG